MNDVVFFVEPDQWLSKCLRRKVGKFSFGLSRDFVYEGSPVGKTPLEDWDFIYAKISPAEINKMQFLEDTGFYLVDTNLLLEKTLGKKDRKAGNRNIRFASDGDKEHVKKLAGRSFTYSRFHLDPYFTKRTANRIKTFWAGCFFSGSRGNAMVVAEGGNSICGFLQLLYLEEEIIIDLIAVDARFRRNNIASGMIQFAEENCTGFKKMRAGTQLVNIPSFQLYQKLGFRMISSQYVFHYNNRDDIHDYR